jgi:hypothetical protein
MYSKASERINSSDPTSDTCTYLATLVNNPIISQERGTEDRSKPFAMTSTKNKNCNRIFR